MMRPIYTLSLALSIALLPTNFALGASSPSYKDGFLTIPSVNTADQVGEYQDVTFKLTEQGVWQLLNVRAIGTYVAGTLGVGLALIEKVEVVMTDTFPVQVFLRVAGGMSLCSSMGQVNQRLENNRFDVAITYNNLVSGQAVACLPGFTTFVKTIPLPVYGLSAGIYSYGVNSAGVSGITGSFELTADNRLPGGN